MCAVVCSMYVEEVHIYLNFGPFFSFLKSGLPGAQATLYPTL